MAKAAERLPDARPELVRVGSSHELAGDGPYALSAGGLDLVLLRTKSGPRAFQGRCPHQGALLGEGELEGSALVCRNHRWRFDAETGRREGGPECLVACPVVERDGSVLVDPAPLAAADAARAAEARAARAARRRPADLPGPRALPLLGNMFDLDLPRLHLVFERWAAEYGPLFKFRMGRAPVVVVSDMALAQPILRARPETYRRTSKLEPIFEELGVNGLFSAEGAAWRPQRRLAMEALASRHLAGFYPTLRMVADRLRERWKGAAQRGDTLDVADELKRFTVDVTTVLTFGHDINTIEQTGDDVIQRRLELLFPTFNRRIFAPIPWWRFFRTPRDRRLDRALAELRVWIEGLVREARARLDADPERAARPANFLEAMLAARDEQGQPFSDRVIFGNLMTMLLAGEDTTAYTLAWAVHHLCDSPPSVAALEAELDAVLGADPAPRDIDAANRLAYAGAVANETMRLRPVAPMLFFETLAPTTVGDVDLPVATTVVVLMRTPAVTAKSFHEPEAFRPERWLGGAGGAHDASSHLPFGSGPRICPGRSLAILEMKVVLALLYRSFTVTRVGPTASVREHFAFTMSPHGLAVRLASR
jgi:cytochrome P450/nitrite reductase/ring-hydroxylating ferredoxin subunit